MTSLRSLQLDLQSRIVAGDAAIDDRVAASDSTERACRLHIYEHAYVARLVDALVRAYPALCRTLGEPEFRGLAVGYVRAVPSVHRSIRDYGADLPAHVERSRAGVTGRVLAELARWEWLLADVFDAADASALTVAALAAIPPDEWGALELRPHPTLRRFTTATNAIELWRHATDAATSEAAAHCESRPVAQWAAWRAGLDTQYRSLEADESDALDMLLAGTSFGEVCERLAAHDADGAPLRAAQLLRTWLESGLVRG